MNKKVLVWKQLPTADFEHMDAQEVWQLDIHGIPMLLAVLANAASDFDDHDDEEERDEDGNGWGLYACLTQEADGFAGYEHLDTFDSLEEVKEYAEGQREELISVAASMSDE